MERTVMK